MDRDTIPKLTPEDRKAILKEAFETLTRTATIPLWMGFDPAEDRTESITPAPSMLTIEFTENLDQSIYDHLNEIAERSEFRTRMLGRYPQPDNPWLQVEGKPATIKDTGNFKAIEITSAEEAMKRSKHCGWCLEEPGNTYYQSRYQHGKLYAFYRIKPSGSTKRRPSYLFFAGPTGVEFEKKGAIKLDATQFANEMPDKEFGKWMIGMIKADYPKDRPIPSFDIALE